MTTLPAPTGNEAAPSHPIFNPKVEVNGYRWWYLDAISDDKQHALTIIVFIGSVFSPYYRWARDRGPAAAHDHCAVNVALYGASGKRWAMTERDSAALSCRPAEIRVGPSAARWNGSELVIDLDEISVPVPSRIRGQVRLRPESSNDRQFELDSRGLHLWQPIFPRARAEISLSHPRLRWQGDAYYDTNHGLVPLEDDFVGWNWSRLSTPEGGSTILYNREIIGHGNRSLGLNFDPAGRVTEFGPSAETRLPSTRIWRIPRATRASPEQDGIGEIRTLEDTPFYARSLLSVSHRGQILPAVHESLSMSRFNRAWVRMLLPFKMPRRKGRHSSLRRREV